jgi:3-hydroxyisobutyrate dehydrogenase-like beta-hydroxyacid dehydrogenase
VNTSTKPPSIGFVGFGEAAYHIAKGLRESGIQSTVAYDLHADTPGRGKLIRQRAEDTETRLVPSNARLAGLADIVFSTVTANQALAAAEQTAAHLKPGQIYADLNSVSPGLKQALAGIIEAGGGRFVEVAVMAPVPPHNHKVPLLTGGAAAPDFADLMRPFGMRIETGVARVGAAAATKMCRSIMVKGIEALMTECVLSATHYGVDEKVLESLNETFPGMDWVKMASYLVGRVAVHGERRAREMEEVAGTVEEAGVEPIMVSAIVRRMDWSAELGLREAFGGKAPADYREFAAGVSGAMLRQSARKSETDGR